MKRIKYRLSEEQLKRIKLTSAELEVLEKSQQKNMFENIITVGIRAVYKNGIGGKLQRSFSRILDKLDADGEGCLNLEETEFDLLKEIITSDSTRFDPGMTRLVSMYENVLNSAENIG